MAKQGDYSIGGIYRSGPSSFDPEYGSVFTGYTTSAGSLGMSTDARTANVLKEVSAKLAMGVKNVELSQVDKGVFESIPVGYLKEVNRLAKLTGTEVTLHAPVVEPTGMDQQGKFDETNRQAVERQMKFAMERAQELNPQGNSPVTFHATAAFPGSEWKMEGDKKVYTKLIATNRETGQMTALTGKERFYPGQEKIRAEAYSPTKELDIMNHSEWDNALSQVFFNQERAGEIVKQNEVLIQHLQKDLDEDNFKPKHLTPQQQQAWRAYKSAQNYLQEVNQQANALFSKAYQYGTDVQKKQLEKVNEEFREALKKNPTLTGQVGAMQDLINELKNPALTPEMWISGEKFAVEKASKTFGNVAFHAFKEYGKNASIVSIENPPAGGGLATGEDLKNLVEASKEKFIEQAMKPKDQGGLNMSKDAAKKEADRMIGVTWDVGHINMLRKQGLGKTEIIKETEHIAKLVKHVHLSDNFGLEHTELPMGMGNVPLKEIMAKIGKEGYKGKKVVEAVSWWQHFQSPPFVQSLQGVGASMYSDGVGPYWNQNLGFQQGYGGGFGLMVPQKSYEIFGGGFSMLPTDLGGSVQAGGGSRMGGTPME